MWVFLLSGSGFVSVCQHSSRGGDHGIIKESLVYGRVPPPLVLGPTLIEDGRGGGQLGTHVFFL